VRRRLPRAQVVLALAPGACARGAGRAIDAAPDGVVADVDAATAGAAPVAGHLATVERAYRRLARAAARRDRRAFAGAAGEVVAAERALDAATARSRS
jgi:hypothetical protein